jgi:stress-induced morphogen
MTPAEVKKLKSALKKHFGAIRVDAECVNAKGRYRFAIVAPQFDGKPQLERQDAIWTVVDQVLPRESTIDISLILAFAPDELETAA